MVHEVVLREGFTDGGTVEEWLKSEGDRVEEGETLVRVESQKATVDVTAPISGRLTRICLREGEAFEEGSVIACIEDGQGIA
jgi:pyruvate/2-oxoglutarate dehydrogenase complex dihydrolipoamide acyltransferase (E2) component